MNENEITNNLETELNADTNECHVVYINNVFHLYKPGKDPVLCEYKECLLNGVKEKAMVDVELLSKIGDVFETSNFTTRLADEN